MCRVSGMHVTKYRQVRKEEVLRDQRTLGDLSLGTVSYF